MENTILAFIYRSIAVSVSQHNGTFIFVKNVLRQKLRKLERNAFALHDLCNLAQKMLKGYALSVNRNLRE